ncbi:TetR/AcrR family transcriptional regulator [Streptomyces shenzhenensis]|uniref:TetR family transcriptional regulator n=1 Tax=Streptomyces shenzhenensis TaxID=943815 RepID=A0A3M0I0T5_9ACTN|nr:TetR-like C-terminal domain-containing protein [Streptomyces shenzhenensis]RMB82404.1 TetR family transcriptional regulator [Streptomyces shenzhenensis]
MAESTGRPRTARVRNPRGQGGRLREQLVEAAAHLLADADQPESLTLRSVAREVGVAPASIYGHFPDLGALLDQVLELRYRELTEALRSASEGLDGSERLMGLCAAYVGWGLDHPGEYRTLFGGRIPAGVTVASHETGIGLLAVLTAALPDPLADGDDVKPDERQRAGLLLWTSLHGLVSARMEHPGIPWPPWREHVADIVALHGAAGA